MFNYTFILFNSYNNLFNKIIKKGKKQNEKYI